MADSILQTTSFEGMGIRNLYPKELVSCLYAEDNNNLCALEPSIAGNDVVISYPQQSSGSSNSFKFNESFPFISQMFSQYQWQLHLRAPVATASSATVAFSTDYPAYGLIQDMRYQVSGTEQQIIYGESMIDYLNELVENDAKKNQLMELAGRRVVQVSLPSALSVTDQTNLINQYALHILPWVDPKGMQVGNNTKPFPIYRCQNGVEIIMRMRQFTNSAQNSLVTGNNFQNGPVISNIIVAGIGATADLNLSSAYLFFKYHKVANPMMEKKIKMAYPFQTIRNLQTTQVALTSNQTLSGSYNTVQLNGFAQGQTTNILFHYVDSTSSTQPFADIYAGLPIDNVKLLFNGKVIYQSNTLQDCMWDVLSANRRSFQTKRRLYIAGASEIQNDVNYNVLSYANTSADFEVDAYPSATGIANVIPAKSAGRQYYYNIPIAETRLSEMHQLGEFTLGGNFSKESLQLQFRVPQGTVASTGTLYISYVYSGIYYISENRECTLSW